MQITEFSKAINFFLVGALLTTTLALWIWKGPGLACSIKWESLRNQSLETYPADAESEFSGGLAIVVVTLVVPISLFLGVLLEGIASPLRNIATWFVRKLQKNPRRERVLEICRYILGVDSAYRHMDDARSRFKTVLTILQKAEYQTLPDNAYDRAIIGSSGLPLNNIYRQIAMSIALWKSSPEMFTWMTSHYSTYILCTNYAMASIPLAFLLFGDLGSSLYSLAASTAAFYFFVHLALERRLYSYELIYRQAFATLIFKNETDTALLKRVFDPGEPLSTEQSD